MVDFWFTLGATVIDPSLLTDIGNQHLVFTPIAETIQETLNNVGQPLLTPRGGMGYLDTNPPAMNATMSLRTFIRTRMEHPPVGGVAFAQHPPISLYTAAKFTQLCASFGAVMTNAVRLANQAYRNAIKKYPIAGFSPHFPTLLGSIFVDSDMPGYLTTLGNPDIAAEFGITAQERQVMLAWIADPAFNDPNNGAQVYLLTKVYSWDVVCREVMISYDKFKRAAN